MVAFKDRTGERFISNEGCEFVIVEYKNAKNVLIEFQDEYKFRKSTTYNVCKTKEITNPFHPKVVGHGYVGVGEHKTRENGKPTKAYRYWCSMLERGFSEEFKKNFPTYKDVTVNSECFCFQDFGEWFDNNYYEIEGERMCIDKDILVKGNKEYSFDTMIFVPHRINSLFTKSDVARGNCPIGVSYKKEIDKYQANCNVVDENGNKKLKFLGYYDNQHKAFLAYKEFKEAYIKEVADKYKGRIPDRLYEAMYNWIVEEDD